MTRLLVVDASVVVDLLARFRPQPIEDLLWADGLIFGTPENFGYMSGALKDFFDRCLLRRAGSPAGRRAGDP